MLPTTCLRATGYGLAIFIKICHSAELNKMIEATAPVNLYDNHMATGCLRAEREIRASYWRRAGLLQAKCKLGIRRCLYVQNAGKKEGVPVS